MASSIEDRGGLLRGVKLSISNQVIQEQVDARLQEVSHKINVKGFRPGHVPHGEARRRFGPEIEEEVTHKAMADAFFEWVTAESIRLACPPKFKPSVVITAEGQYRFEAEFEVLPEFEFIDFSELKVRQSEAEVTDKDVDKSVQSFLRSRQVFEEDANRAAEIGDQLTLEWTSTAYDADNNPHEDSREDSKVVLDTAQLPEPLVEGLKGVQAGDERTVNMPHPEPASDTEPTDGASAKANSKTEARKPAVIYCKIKSVAAPRLPEIDEAFIQTLGLEHVQDEAGFRAHIKQNLDRRLKDSVWQDMKAQILKQLSERHPDIHLPESLVDQEVQRFKEQNADRMDAAQMTDEMESQLRTSAADSVRLQLVVEKIIREQEIIVNPEQVKERVEQMAEGHPEPQRVKDWYYGNEQQLKRIENMVLEDQVVQFVLDQAQVESKQTTFDEAIQAQNAPL